jgi:hypothetical protein
MAHSASVIATQDGRHLSKFPSSMMRRPESGNGKANDVVYLLIDLNGGGLPMQYPLRFGDGFPGARVGDLLTGLR